MSSSQASAIRSTPHPGLAGLPLNPKPGSVGQTRWNASAALPPNATGSVSGSMTLRNSTTEPGQPWVMTSGVAPGWGERTCTKWMSRSLTRVRNCGNRLSRACAAGHSYSISQYRHSSRT